MNSYLVFIGMGIHQPASLGSADGNARFSCAEALGGGYGIAIGFCAAAICCCCRCHCRDVCRGFLGRVCAQHRFNEPCENTDALSRHLWVHPPSAHVNMKLRFVQPAGQCRQRFSKVLPHIA